MRIPQRGVIVRFFPSSSGSTNFDSFVCSTSLGIRPPSRSVSTCFFTTPALTKSLVGIRSELLSRLGHVYFRINLKTNTLEFTDFYPFGQPDTTDSEAEKKWRRLVSSQGIANRIYLWLIDSMVEKYPLVSQLVSVDPNEGRRRFRRRLHFPETGSVPLREFADALRKKIHRDALRSAGLNRLGLRARKRIPPGSSRKMPPKPRSRRVL